MITETYRDIEIIYRETENVWNFTVNGKERNRESLLKARESIDNALDKEVKEKPWQPFDAYLCRFGDIERVKVTSEADSGYSGKRYWIVRSDKKRVRESGHNLYAVNAENDRLLAEWRELDARIDQLTEQRTAKLNAMVRINPQGTK